MTSSDTTTSFPIDEALTEAIRDSLSPHAVAAIACYLQAAKTNNENVNREIHWFNEQLGQMVGGWDHHRTLAHDLGL